MIFNHTLSWLIKASWYQSLSSRVSAHLHSRVRNLPRWILCGVDPQLAVVLSSAARRSPLSLVAVVTLLRLHQPVDLRLRLRLRLRLPPQSPSSSAPQLVDLLCRSSRLCRRRLCCVGELFLPTLYIAYKILMMLAVDPSKKISFNRCIGDGDLVIVYERHDNMKAVKVCENSVLQNRFGVFKHSDWIGKPFGSKVLSNKGGFVYLLAPTPELWTLVLSHRTQILYIADISFVIMYLEIVPGCLVLESGTGSGSLTTSLARAVAPTGHVYTFDFHEQRAVSAREDFERTGLSSLVTVGVRDIQGEGFPDDFCGKADSVFLDLPQPWLAIPSAGKMLKQDGILCSFSPCIEQVQRSCETLRANFTDVRTFEVLLRMYEVREGKMENSQAEESVPTGSHRCKRRQRSSEGGNGMEISSSPTVMARPSSEARGHTGYLTFARLMCLS